MVLLKQLHLDIHQSIQNIFLDLLLHILSLDFELCEKLVLSVIIGYLDVFLNFLLVMLTDDSLCVLICHLKIKQLFAEGKIVLKVLATVFVRKYHLIVLFCNMSLHLHLKSFSFLIKFLFVL